MGTINLRMPDGVTLYGVSDQITKEEALRLHALLTNGSAPPPSAESHGVGDAFARGVSSTLGGTARGIQGLFGDANAAAMGALEDQKKTAEKYGSAGTLADVKAAYDKDGVLGAAKSLIGQGIEGAAEMAPFMGQIMGGAWAGSKAGAPFGVPGRIAGAVLGTAASTFPSHFGGNLAAQAAVQQQKGEAVNVDTGKAALAATGQAALDASLAAIPAGRTFLNSLKGAASAATTTAEKAALRATLTKAAEETILKGTAKTTGIMMPVITAQSVLTRAQAGQDVISGDALDEYGQVLWQTAVGTPLIGAASTAYGRQSARNQLGSMNKADAIEAAQRGAVAQRGEGIRQGVAGAVRADAINSGVEGAAARVGETRGAIERAYAELERTDPEAALEYRMQQLRDAHAVPAPAGKGKKAKAARAERQAGIDAAQANVDALLDRWAARNDQRDAQRAADAAETQERQQFPSDSGTGEAVDAATAFETEQPQLPGMNTRPDELDALARVPREQQFTDGGGRPEDVGPARPMESPTEPAPVQMEMFPEQKSTEPDHAAITQEWQAKQAQLIQSRDRAVQAAKAWRALLADTTLTPEQRRGVEQNAAAAEALAKEHNAALQAHNRKTPEKLAASEQAARDAQAKVDAEYQQRVEAARAKQAEAEAAEAQQRTLFPSDEGTGKAADSAAAMESAPVQGEFRETVQHPAEERRLGAVPRNEQLTDGGGRPEDVGPANEPPPAQQVITPELLREFGLPPNSGFWKRLVGKDVMNPEHRAEVNRVLQELRAMIQGPGQFKTNARRLYDHLFFNFGETPDMFGGTSPDTAARMEQQRTAPTAKADAAEHALLRAESEKRAAVASLDERIAHLDREIAKANKWADRSLADRHIEFLQKERARLVEEHKLWVKTKPASMTPDAQAKRAAKEATGNAPTPEPPAFVEPTNSRATPKNGGSDGSSGGGNNPPPSGGTGAGVGASGGKPAGGASGKPTPPDRGGVGGAGGTPVGNNGRKGGQPTPVTPATPAPKPATPAPKPATPAPKPATPAPKPATPATPAPKARAATEPTRDASSLADGVLKRLAKVVTAASKGMHKTSEAEASDRQLAVDAMVRAANHEADARAGGMSSADVKKARTARMDALAWLVETAAATDTASLPGHINSFLDAYASVGGSHAREVASARSIADTRRAADNPRARSTSTSKSVDPRKDAARETRAEVREAEAVVNNSEVLKGPAWRAVEETYRADATSYATQAEITHGLNALKQRFFDDPKAVMEEYDVPADTPLGATKEPAATKKEGPAKGGVEARSAESFETTDPHKEPAVSNAPKVGEAAGEALGKLERALNRSLLTEEGVPGDAREDIADTPNSQLRKDLDDTRSKVGVVLEALAEESRAEKGEAGAKTTGELIEEHNQAVSSLYDKALQWIESKFGSRVAESMASLPGIERMLDAVTVSRGSIKAYTDARAQLANWFLDHPSDVLRLVSSTSKDPRMGYRSGVRGYVDVHERVATVIVGALKKGGTAKNIHGTALHELGHLTMTEADVNSITRATYHWGKMEEGSLERKVYDMAAERMGKYEGNTRTNDEFVQQLVSAAVEHGVEPSAVKEARAKGKTWRDIRSVQDFIDVFADMVRSKVRDLLNLPDAKITAQDLIDFSYGNARDAMKLATKDIPERTHSRALWTGEDPAKTPLKVVDISKDDGVSAMIDPAAHRELEAMRLRREALPGVGPAYREIYRNTGALGVFAGWLSGRDIGNLRTVLADRMANIKDRFAAEYNNELKNAQGKINPVLRMIQAASSANMVQHWIAGGELVRNKATGQFEVREAKGFEAPAKVFEILNKWSKDNNRDFRTAYNEVSDILQAVRIKEDQLASKDGQGSFISHMAQPTVDTLYAAYKADPELQAISKVMDDARHHLIDKMQEVGRLDEDLAKAWKDISGYVPFDRVEEFDTHLRVQSKKVGRGVAQIGKLPKDIVGSKSRLPKNVFENYFKLTSWMLQSVVQQDATLHTLRKMEGIGAAKLIGMGTPHIDNPNRVVRTFIKGKPAVFEVESVADAVAFATHEYPNNALYHALSRVSSILRTAVTAHPMFSAKQINEDIQRALMVSGVTDAPAFTAKALSNFASLSKSVLMGESHPIMERMGRKGVFGEIDFRQDNPAESYLKDLGAIGRTNFFGSKKLSTILHKGEMIAQASDLAVRAAIHDQTLKETGNEALALYRAREIINFRNRGAGDRLGAMNLFITSVPFFNSKVQSMYVELQAITGKNAPSGLERKQAQGYILKRAAQAVAIAALYSLARGGNVDDPDDPYGNMDDIQRDKMWILGHSGKHAYGLPVPNEMGVILKAIPERVLLYYKRQGTPSEQTAAAAVESWFNAAYEEYAGRMVLEPLGTRPLIESLTNHSFATGRPLVGAHMQKLEGPRQFNDTTSGFAKSVAKHMYDVTGVQMSPIHIDNFLSGYFGTTYAWATAVTNQMIEPNRVDTPLYKMAGLGPFVRDAIGKRNLNEFYGLLTKVDTANATFKDLEAHDVDAAYKYMEQNTAKLAVYATLHDTLVNLAQTREYSKLLNSVDGAKMVPSKEERRKQLDQLRSHESKMTEYIWEIRRAYNL